MHNYRKVGRQNYYASFTIVAHIKLRQTAIPSRRQKELLLGWAAKALSACNGKLTLK